MNRMKTKTQSEEVGVPELSQGTQMPASSSSRSQRMVVQTDAGFIEDYRGSDRDRQILHWIQHCMMMSARRSKVSLTMGILMLALLCEEY